jgi:hypothetical protein
MSTVNADVRAVLEREGRGDQFEQLKSYHGRFGRTGQADHIRQQVHPGACLVVG